MQVLEDMLRAWTLDLKGNLSDLLPLVEFPITANTPAMGWHCMKLSIESHVDPHYIWGCEEKCVVGHQLIQETTKTIILIRDCT